MGRKIGTMARYKFFTHREGCWFMRAKRWEEVQLTLSELELRPPANPPSAQLRCRLLEFRVTETLLTSIHSHQVPGCRFTESLLNLDFQSFPSNCLQGFHTVTKVTGDSYDLTVHPTQPPACPNSFACPVPQDVHRCSLSSRKHSCHSLADTVSC